MSTAAHPYGPSALHPDPRPDTFPGAPPGTQAHPAPRAAARPGVHAETRSLAAAGHAVLVAAALPLCLGALLSDWAYAASFQVQWKNFAAWLGAGALLLLGPALLWALVEVLRAGARRDRRAMPYLLVVLAAFALGVFSALVHAKDGWAAMPEGLVLSAVFALLTLAACVLGLARLRRGELR